MFKKVIFGVLICVFLLNPLFLFAQANIEDVPLDEVIEEIEEPKLDPKITSEEFVKVGKKIIFDATQSELLEEGYPVYSWDLGDGYKQVGEEVVHQYNKIGKYNISLKISQGEAEEIVEKEVFVYDTKALLIIDEKKEEEIDRIKLQAAENGVALKLLSIVEGEGGFLSEDKLVKAISELGDYIDDSQLILFYSRSPLGLQAFTRYWQGLEEDIQLDLAKKYYVSVADNSMEVAGNFVFQSFKIIQPDYILLTRPEAISPLFTLENYAEAVDVLKSRGVEFKIIDERGKKSPAFFLSGLVTLLVSKGVTGNTIYLILMIPFLAFFVTFFRQVIGLSTFGVYTPVMVVASFFILGLGFGLLTFLFAVVTSHIVKRIVNKFELLYLPKVALNLSFISLSFLIVIWIALLFDISISFSLAIFPMLVMSNVAEKFMAAQTEEGFKGALIAVIQTLIVVVVSYYIIIWTSFNNWVMSWPELILAPLILTLLIGKFTGLRLSEYLRFRSLFSEHTEE